MIPQEHVTAQRIRRESQRFRMVEVKAGFGGVLLKDEIRHRVAAFRAKPDRCELSDRSI